MARIRTVKPEFWTSESLATRLPGADGRQARLLFIALWNHAEDHGVCRASPTLLRSQAFPYDEDVTSGDVSRWLGMLEAGGFIVRYERNGSAYAWVRGFDEHQKIDRKSKTTLPDPSREEMDDTASTRDAPDHPASETVAPVASPRRALDESSLQEGKGREGNGKDSASQGAADASPAAGQTVLVDVAPAEKPKRAPNASAMGEFIDWARAETKPRLPADALDPAAGMKVQERSRLGEAVKLHGLEALKAAFRLFMGWEVAQQKGYSVGFFANGWERWVQQAKATPARNFGTTKAENKPNTPNILELEARWKAARQ